MPSELLQVSQSKGDMGKSGRKTRELGKWEAQGVINMGRSQSLQNEAWSEEQLFIFHHINMFALFWTSLPWVGQPRWKSGLQAHLNSSDMSLSASAGMLHTP
jgi:hypothetical protein